MYSDRIVQFFMKITIMALILSIVNLGKSCGSMPFMKWTVNPAVGSPEL